MLSIQMFTIFNFIKIIKRLKYLLNIKHIYYNKNAFKIFYFNNFL